MKKKISILLIMILVICLTSGCGKKEVSKQPVAVTNGIGTVVAGGAKEVVEKATEEATDIEPVKLEESEVIEEVEEPEEVEEIIEDVRPVDEFPAIADDVSLMDNSSEYGVYSTSCFDLEQYLDEDGCLPGFDDYEDKMYSEYSGRWAYPKITPCRFFTDMIMKERTDDCEFFTAVDEETGHDIALIIHSGYSYYNARVATMDSVYDWAPSFMFTAQTVDGETDVIAERFENNFTLEGEEPNTEIQYIYYFRLGSFSVSLYSSEYELSEDEVQLVIDNIRVTNGLER